MISMIAAMTKDRVLGKDNQLIWHISEDLKNFKRLTSGHTIVMGRKTFESIGKPLKKRRNIVISRTMVPQGGLEVYGDVETALEKAREGNTDIYIIGGAQVYKDCLPYADTMHLSHVKADYEGDVYFPEFEKDEWETVEEMDYPEYVYRVYKRKSGTTP